MVENSAAIGRLWRRVVGMGAFALFLSGILVAVGLSELVILVGFLGGLCILAGVVTLLFARYRRGVLAAVTHLVVTTARVATPLAALGSKSAWRHARRLMGASSRVGHAVVLATAADIAASVRVGRELRRRAVPALERASRAFLGKARSVGRTVDRHASRAAAVVMADIHSQREAVRSSRLRTRPRGKPHRRPRRPESRRQPR